MNHLNIEIKASCQNQNYIRDLLLANNARFVGTDNQIDTYFNVNSGRLKLREGNIENHLIHYDRENIEGPKQSNVLLYDSNPKSTLKEILVKSLGILVIVDKKREIYFIDNVKFHLDTVKDLGTFIEIEAIDMHLNIGREKLLEQCKKYMSLFNIAPEHLLSTSYSDMLLNKKS